MTEKLEELLAAEFRNGSYDLVVDADRLTTTLRRRRARRNAVTVAGAGVALATALGVSAGFLGGFGAPTPPADPVTALATTAARRLTADSAQLGDVVVRGLPADAKLATDPATALAQPPAVELPPTGDRAAFTVPSAADTTIRLVVVAGAAKNMGLPGVVDDQAWLRSLGGAHALLTVDDANHTTYLNATTPAGQRWALAASGPDGAARLALVRQVATATMPGK